MSYRWSHVRMALGAYLVIHFGMLIPWAREVFSREGVRPAAASPLLRLFPNALALCDAPWAVTALLVLGVASAAALALGRHDRAAALVCWYVWACLFGRNPLIANPSLAYVGLLLWVHALRPASGELSPSLRWTLWALMALGYSYSGWAKLTSSSWLDGTAILRVLESPLARPSTLRTLALELPRGLLQAVSYGVLGLELAFASLACIRPLRPWLWGALLALHLSLLLFLDFADLSLGMVLLHAATFNPAWLKAQGGVLETCSEEASAAEIGSPGRISSGMPL